MEFALLASVMSFCPSVSNNSAPTGRIFTKFDIWVIFFFWKSEERRAHFTCKPIYIFDHIPLSSRQNEKCFRQKLYRKSKHTFFCSVTLFFLPPKSYRLCDNVGKYSRVDRPQMAVWRMRIACWVTKATDTHSEYVKLNAFPPQQLLRERAIVLGCTYIVFLVSNQLSDRHILWRKNWFLLGSSIFSNWFHVVFDIEYVHEVVCVVE